MKILVAEDDPDTASFLKKGLGELGHVVDVVTNGRDAFMQASSEEYDLLVLDRMLPGMDGLAVLRAARETGATTPAIFLTALDGVSDRVAGLNAGGDDYLVKPFAFSELVARVNALARRPRTNPKETELAVGDLRVDLLTRRVLRAGQLVELQPQEYRLLEFLMRHAGQIVTRTMLLEGVWGFHFDPKTSVVETHMSRLRAKVDRNFAMQLIKTVRGAGYMIDANDGPH